MNAAITDMHVIIGCASIRVPVSRTVWSVRQPQRLVVLDTQRQIDDFRQ